MKKQTISVFALGAVLAGSVSAQSMYDLAPDDTETDSFPLTYTAGINLGYDDNPTPLLAGGDDSAMYGNAFVGAAFVRNTPQATLSFGAQVGVIHYFDDLGVGPTDVDDTFFTVSTYLNWTKRVSERLRFVSRNNLTYELEPDYSVGFQAQRQTGNYFRWSTDNSVGYRWTDRLATYTGFSFSGITFDEFDGGDREFWTVYNDFRYQVSERTVATFTYRFQDVSADAQVTDATNQFILVGVEHRFSPRSTAVVRGGVQIRDVDEGEDSTNPYLEAAINTQVSEVFSIRTYARYSAEDFQRALQFPNLPGQLTVYSNTDTLRLGVSGNYQLSQEVTLTGGVNYALLDFSDVQRGNGPDDIEEELLNLFIGVDYKLNESVMLNARYNFEDLSSDTGAREYDRNRFSIGASTQF